MLYDFGRIFGVEVDTKIQTKAVTVLDTENKGTVNLTTNVGSFYLNGTEVGSVVDAVAGDELFIELTTPSGYVSTLFTSVYQDGILVSICSITTTFDPASEFDPAYIDLEPYEVLPASIWEPSSRAYYEQFGTYITHDLFDKPSDSFTLTRHVICDYHRDQLYFCSPTKGIAKIITNELTKPASSADFYNANGLRIAHVVLYRGQNTLAVFQDYYRDPSLDIVLDSDALKIKMHNSSLYVLYKNAELVLYTLSEDTFEISEGTVISENVLDFVTDDGNLAYIKRDSGIKLIDFDDSVTSLIETATTLAYNSILNSFAVGHKSTGAITVVSGEIGSRESTYDSATGFLYISYIEAHGNYFYAAGEFNGILKFDGSTKIFYPKEDPIQGIVDFNNYLLVTYLYTDIDPKINIIDMQPDYYVFDSQLLPGPGSIIRTEDKIVAGLGAPTVLSVPDLLDPEMFIILNGEELSVKSVTVDNGDVFSIKVIPNTKFDRRLDLPVILGSSKRDLTLLPIPGTVLPKDTGFGPVVGDVAYEEKSTQSRTFPFLEEKDTIYVSVDVGQVIVNDIPMGRNANIGSGDLVRFSNFIPGGRCTTDYQTITYGEDLFTTVIAYKQSDTDSAKIVGLGAPGTNVVDVWENAVPGSTVRTGESIVKTQGSATFEIPELYDAILIKNGMKVGTRSNYRDGDILQIELTTTGHYNTEHRLSLTSCTSSYAWRVYNSPDLYVDPFDLGSQEDLAISDYVVSNEVTISGLGYRQAADIVIPYGTILFINGVQHEIAQNLLDYRGVLIEDLLVPRKIVEGDRLRLEGYPRNTYGTLQLIPLRIGYSTGYWSLKTYHVDPFKASLTQSNYITAPISSKQPFSFYSEGMKIELNRALFSKAKTVYAVDLKPTTISHFAETPVVESESNFIPESILPIEMPKLEAVTQPILEGFVAQKSAIVEPILEGFVAQKSAIVEPSFDRLFKNRLVLADANNPFSSEPFKFEYNVKEEFTSTLFTALTLSEIHFISSALSADFSSVNENIVPFGAYEHTVLDIPESYLSPYASAEQWDNLSILTPSLSVSLHAEDLQANSFHVAILLEIDHAESYVSNYFTVTSPIAIFDKEVPIEISLSNFEAYLDPNTMFSSSGFVYNATSTFFFKLDWESSDPLAVNTSKFDWIPSLETVEPLVLSDWHVPKPHNIAVVYSHWIPDSTRVNSLFDVSWESLDLSDVYSWKPVYLAEAGGSFVDINTNWIASSESFSEARLYGYIAEKVSYYESSQFKALIDESREYTFQLNETNAPLRKDVEMPLQNVFSSRVLALADAEKYGLTSIDVNIIAYQDSYIWVHAMPCNNMCGECPETGYIHGG